MERVKSLDLYLLLEIEQDVEEKAIKKAYRKKALTCHPDKNPGDKKAVELFHQLSDALEVLTDEATRRAYDNLLKARKAAELRGRQLDSKRRKFKDQLEEREQGYEDEAAIRQREEDKLLREIERLRKEGSRQLAEEQEAVKKQLVEERLGKSRQQEDSQGGRVKVKWDKKGSRQYEQSDLEKIFFKYGTVAGTVIGGKGGSALVEFDSLMSARMAVNIETGYLENPLKVKPLWEENFQHSAAPPVEPVSDSSTDFESLVMRKLRQEEERKKLIQKIMEEERNG